VTIADRLALFNTKVDKLSGLTFFERVTTKKTTTKLHWDRDKGWESAFDGPGDESIDAAVLTLRQFMQDNDPVSVRNVSDAYLRSSLSTALRGEFQLLRSHLNQFLDSPTNVAIEEGRLLTFRRVLDLFVYGGLAHSSPRHRATYEGLKTSPFYHVIQADFVQAVGIFIIALRHMAAVNTRAIAALQMSGRQHG